MAVLGTCFGYQISSPLALRYLRPGTARDRLWISEDPLDDPPLEVGDLLEESRPGDGGTIRVYVRPEAYHVWMDHAGWFRVDPDRPSITVPPSPHAEWREALIWGLPAALCVIERGDLVLHAASIEVEGRALALAGPAGQGKSTLATAFLRAGHGFLSDDLTPCRTTDGPRVVPGPALLRLHHELVARLPVPGTHQVTQDVDKVHLRVEVKRLAEEVELAGVVLVRGRSGGARLERMPAVACLPDLWAVSLNIPTNEGRARCFRQISALAGSVPVWELAIEPGLEKLPGVVDTLVERCLP